MAGRAASTARSSSRSSGGDALGSRAPVTPRAVLWLAVVAAEGVALVMAVRRLRNERSFAAESKAIRYKSGPQTSAPIVALLAFAIVEDVAVRLLIDLVIVGAPRPLHGSARAAYHLADALVMAWPLGLAWASWQVFGPKPSGFAASNERAKGEGVWNIGRLRIEKRGHRALDLLVGLYLGAFVALVSMHPLGVTRTKAVLLAWEVVALTFAVVAIARGWRRVGAGGPPWTRAHATLLVLVPVEAAVVCIGPFARPNVFTAWEVARWQYLAGFVVVAGVFGLRRAGSPPQ